MHPAICALVEFAAQNPKLELGNYGFDQNGRKAYKQEARNITTDWHRFQNALWEALAAGVKDADVIEAAKSAFSGRLEWVSKEYLREKHSLNTDYTPRWDYTTGQYWPTEYRKAAASVLEYATRDRQRQPKTEQMPRTISELKALNEKNGGCWFGKAEKRFFGTRIESGVIAGHYFITSEQPPHDRRKFTIRSFDAVGDVDTVGEFCAYNSASEARTALNAILAPKMEEELSNR